MPAVSKIASTCSWCTDLLSCHLALVAVSLQLLAQLGLQLDWLVLFFGPLVLIVTLDI